MAASAMLSLLAFLAIGLCLYMALKPAFKRASQKKVLFTILNDVVAAAMRLITYIKFQWRHALNSINGSNLR